MNLKLDLSGLRDDIKTLNQSAGKGGYFKPQPGQQYHVRLVPFKVNGALVGYYLRKQHANPYDNPIPGFRGELCMGDGCPLCKLSNPDVAIPRSQVVLCCTDADTVAPNPQAWTNVPKAISDVVFDRLDKKGAAGVFDLDKGATLTFRVTTKTGKDRYQLVQFDVEYEPVVKISERCFPDFSKLLEPRPYDELVKIFLDLGGDADDLKDRGCQDKALGDLATALTTDETPPWL